MAGPDRGSEGGFDIRTGIDLYAVFGSPILHSLSPQMHNYAFRKYQCGSYYIPVEAGPDNFLQRLNAFHEIGGRGANLTRPLKSLIIPLLVEESDAVRRALAANTIVWTSAGWRGENTDVMALSDRLPAGHGARALILGAGGAARASWVALMDRGYEVDVMAREPRRVWAGPIAREWDLQYVNDSYSVIINATPLGQSGEPSWDVSKLPDLTSPTIVVDWVYSPRLTPLLAWAKAQSEGIIVDGLSLLIGQARWAWQLWFGQRAPADVLEEAVSWQPLS